MISIWDVKKSITDHPDGDIYLSEDNVIMSKKYGKICTLDEMVHDLRKKYHCDFESIFCCHATLDNIIRCKECGTVIFTSNSVDLYEPGLLCPKCTGKQCNSEYWTKEMIDADSKKKNTIDRYIKMQNELIEMDRRRNRRKGLSDQEIKKWTIDKNDFMVKIILECDNLFSKTHFKLKGLRLKIKKYKKESYFRNILDKSYTIPLSISYFLANRKTKKYIKEN